MTFRSRHISIAIHRSPSEVYAFASNPENLPQWAAGLSSGISKSGDIWVADSPMGKISVEFTRPNELGVMDHDVILPSGQRVHNPMRVLRNGDGSELVFTLYKLPDMSDQDFERDAGMVIKDLSALKQLLENEARN